MESNGAIVHGGDKFWSDSSGRWAGEQLLKAMEAGRTISASELRTLSTLRKDEWKFFDEALIEEGTIRLKGVADLIAMGLTQTIPNGLGKTVYQYEKVTDMNPAQISMDGIVASEGDRQEFSLHSLPLPIIHKDFFLHLRTLIASRERGEPLDTTQARTAGRLVAESVENLLFNGSTPKFGGLSIYGYTTHPNRNLLDYATAGESWDESGKTGEEMLTDVLNAITALEADRFYGPYKLYVPAAVSANLEADFKAASDKTIRQRLLEVDQLSSITVVDQLATDNMIFVQPTRDVVMMVQGEPMQSIQWDIMGGFRINFKAFTIQIPLIRADSSGRCGVLHMSTQ